MCRGGRLVADFEAGTETSPDLPAELAEHLTVTAGGLWVVWAYKLAQPAGDQFVPLSRGPAYPVDARAECRARGGHQAPDPGCTCGFHALSCRRLPGLSVRREFAELSVALSGRVLAYEWPGEGTLWRAERQTVVRVDRSVGSVRFVQSGRSVQSGRPVSSVRPDPAEAAGRPRRRPDDPDGRLAFRPAAAPRDSGPVRLSLPAGSPPLVACDDDAGWCAAAAPPRRSPACLVLA